MRWPEEDILLDAASPTNFGSFRGIDGLSLVERKVLFEAGGNGKYEARPLVKTERSPLYERGRVVVADLSVTDPRRELFMLSRELDRMGLVKDIGDE